MDVAGRRRESGAASAKVLRFLGDFTRAHSTSPQLPNSHLGRTESAVRQPALGRELKSKSADVARRGDVFAVPYTCVNAPNPSHRMNAQREHRSRHGRLCHDLEARVTISSQCRLPPSRPVRARASHQESPASLHLNFFSTATQKLFVASARSRGRRSRCGRGWGQQLQSPMKNLEVKLSLSELEFRCKNLYF